MAVQQTHKIMVTTKRQELNVGDGVEIIQPLEEN